MATIQSFADLPCVVRYTHNGQLYLITELIEVKKGDHKYRVLDSEHPLVIHKAEYKAHAKELKMVTDNRPYDKRHPWLTRAVIAANMASFALNILELFRL